jgi:hypothetical protein
MAAAEEAARGRGCSLLTGEAEQGSAAESLYQALGWASTGVVPDYARSPAGALHPAVLFHKRI